MRQASAGASVVNAVSLSVSPVIPTDKLHDASVISSVAVMEMAAVSAFTPPASASESAPIATEQTDNGLNASKAAEKSAAFFGCKLRITQSGWSAGIEPARDMRRSIWPFFTREGRLLPAAVPRTKRPRS